jgi:type II secretory pathway pseudopilin PulG
MRTGRADAGYAMAALLVSLSIMSIMLTVAMPVWKQLTTREKEAELVFRGEQYARAIGLFQRRAGPGVLPPSIDVLVQQKYLRKAYKDPITGKDFALIRAGQSPQIGPGAQGPGSQRPGMSPNSGQQPNNQGRGGSNQPSQGGGGFSFSGRPPASGSGMVSNTPDGAGGGTIGFSPGGAVGGIQGVASTSTAASIRQYNGRTRYNQWEFVFVQQTQSPGAGGAPGTQAPGMGGPGAPGQGRGQGSGRGQGFGSGQGTGPGSAGQGRGQGGGPSFTPFQPAPPASPAGSQQPPPR